MGVNYYKIAKLSSNHFLTANNKLWGKICDWELKLRQIYCRNKKWKLPEILVRKNLAVNCPWKIIQKFTFSGIGYSYII